MAKIHYTKGWHPSMFYVYQVLEQTEKPDGTGQFYKSRGFIYCRKYMPGTRVSWIAHWLQGLFKPQSKNKPAAILLAPGHVLVNFCFTREYNPLFVKIMATDEIQMVFHEMGHALHYLLAESGGSDLNCLPTDIVEFPSVFAETFGRKKSVLQDLAEPHIETKKPIPQHLLDTAMKQWDPYWWAVCGCSYVSWDIISCCSHLFYCACDIRPRVHLVQTISIYD